MFSVIFFVKNGIGGFTAKHSEGFDTYNEALEFYTMNKERYRSQGIYLKISVKGE